MPLVRQVFTGYKYLQAKATSQASSEASRSGLACLSSCAAGTDAVEKLIAVVSSLLPSALEEELSWFIPAFLLLVRQ